ncbi:hypothetical protein [Actinomadura rudentiformis]|uniref:DUF8094 domain-containing protein n=1 Tax=Actinomadura rudentiformis TaxID=359158 RepID=A0A6H9YW23_9ACTN|nr:hypothetical protein [Actinomadura rudentiformis]KAB2351467.1 hypothetical protein F8566_04300 [Actinomadura rudentiformis]
MLRLVLAAGGALSVLATACSADPEVPATRAAEPADKAMVTADEGARILKDWTARHNKAVTSGDERLWRAAVTGGLAAPVSARVRTYGRLPASTRITLLNPVLYVPRQTGGAAKWFAVAALQRSGGKEQQVLALFTRSGDKDLWRAAHWLTFKGKPPELAYDAQGYAIPAPDRGLPAAHAAFLASGARSAFTPDAYTMGARTASYGNWKADAGRIAPGPGTSWALRTKDGGSLVWYGLTQQRTLTGGTEQSLPADVRNYLIRAKRRPGGTVQAGWQWLAIGYAPATGKSTVLGESVSLTTAR